MGRVPKEGKNIKFKELLLFILSQDNFEDPSYRVNSPAPYLRTFSSAYEE